MVLSLYLQHVYMGKFLFSLFSLIFDKSILFHNSDHKCIHFCSLQYHNIQIKLTRNCMLVAGGKTLLLSVLNVFIITAISLFPSEARAIVYNNIGKEMTI